MADKELTVVAGPNGAGKTTFANEYVASRGAEFLSADAIAERLSPGAPDCVQIAASREFIRRVNSALSGADGFVVESTLSGRTFRSVLHDARVAGFTVSIVYLYLDDADACVERVRERVTKGGHTVSELDIRRRFNRSLFNFWAHYRLLSDHWLLLYNVGSQPQDVAIGRGRHVVVRDTELFSRFQCLVNSTNQWPNP